MFASFTFFGFQQTIQSSNHPTVAIPQQTWQSRADQKPSNGRITLETLTKAGPANHDGAQINVRCHSKLTRTGAFAGKRSHTRARLAPFLVLLVCLVTANRGAVAEPRPEPGQIGVVVTIKPIHSLVSTVLHGIATPKLLISGAQSPHHFALKPSDARALHRAVTFIRVGADLEPFTKKVVASLPGSVSVLTLTELAGLKYHSIRADDAFEPHSHDHDHHHSEPDHGHGKSERQTHHDPHIWLDPKNAAVIVNAVAQHFSKLFPEHKERITQNAKKAVAKINALEADIRRTLAPVKDLPFLVFHDAFQYFEKRFDLTGVGAITLHPEAPPSAKRMIQIRATLKKRNVRCVFAEPQFSKKRLTNIVEGTSANVGTLDPLGSDVAAGPAAYGAILRKLAESFSSCFTQS